AFRDCNVTEHRQLAAVDRYNFIDLDVSSDVRNSFFGRADMESDLLEASKEYIVRYGGDVFPNLFTSAKGTTVKDSSGREYLDFTSGQMCATIGHNHPAIVDAVTRA